MFDFLNPKKQNVLQLIEGEKQAKTGALDLSNHDLSIIPVELFELRHLHTLNLRHNHIIDISLLGRFPNITSLYLGNNNIRNISVLTKLPKLINLELSYNRVKNINTLSELTLLSSLNARGINIKDTSFLQNLNNLTFLDLNSNEIENIDFLENLENLKVIDLGKNQIEQIAVLKKMPKLILINLSGNQISKISLEIFEKLFSNIPSINIDSIKVLKNQSVLNQDYENAADLRDIESTLLRKKVAGTEEILTPEQITRIEKIYSSLIFGNNPFNDPPLEIFQQGNAAILRYFAEKEKQGAQKLMEAKLLIVGQGGAGKTSLKRKLHDVNEKMPEPEDTTRGIDVTQLDCKTNNGEDFRLNIWDFGGQNVQHYAHQFFLTGSSLYALVTNEREQNPNFQYWLNIIEMMGAKSPVLIVQNEIAGHSEPIKNAAAIRERFENVVNPFQQVDLSKASSDGRFDKLKEAIIHHALQLPHIGKEYPTSYVRVREALEREAQAGKHYITWKEYNDLCRTAQVDDPDVMQDIATTFTILGVCLHFKDDAVLKKFVFLNPKWIIDALFELLYHQIVIDQQGQFSENDLARIWSHESYADMDDKLIRIMENFELCYLIKDRRNYIVPQRLPAEQQSYGWQESQATRVEYEYKFMPKGIITRLTCRLHEKIEEDHVWNDAVIFKQDKARAFAREVYAENKIAIEVSGNKRADLLNRILDEVDDIHRKSNYANLQVEKKVPCSCAVCSAAKVPHFFNYDYLVELLDDGEYDERCQVSRKKVDIRDILVKTGINFRKDRRLKGVYRESFSLEDEKTIKIFISYSKKDIAFKERLKTQLRNYERRGELALWDDRSIDAGQEWEKEIIQHLENDDLIFLLISPDFIATDYIWEVEVPKALERHRNKEATVIPIILRPCNWGKLDFSHIQALPDKGLPITKWSDQDEAWLSVEKGIEKVLAQL